MRVGVAVIVAARVVVEDEIVAVLASVGSGVKVVVGVAVAVSVAVAVGVNVRVGVGDGLRAAVMIGGTRKAAMINEPRTHPSMMPAASARMIC